VKTTGITAKESATPATIAFKRDSNPNACWNQDAMTMRAKKPRTTEGIPAKNSIAGLTSSRVR
jgi:hypothetical protein